MVSKAATSKATLDFWRRWTTVFGAVLQVASGFLVADSIYASRESLVLPAGWAFGIWGVIFLLCAIYAVYQVLPSKRYDPLFRRVGWPLAIAFVGNGIWTLVQPLRQPILSEIIIVGILIAALTALIRLAHSVSEMNGVQRWIVGLPTGLLTGWLTVANIANLSDMLVREGVIESGLIVALVGAVLIVIGAIVAYVVLRAIASGPLQSSLTYAAGVVWGLFGIVANQYDSSVLTTLVAAVCLVVLVIVVIRVAVDSLNDPIPAKRAS